MDTVGDVEVCMNSNHRALDVALDCHCFTRIKYKFQHLLEDENLNRCARRQNC